MKKILIAGVLAVVAASPALAASRHHRATANEAYASVPYGTDGALVAPSIVSNGQAVGTDPDAFIRESLIRQGSAAEFNN